MRRLNELVPRRGNAVDVGANWGIYSYSLSHLGGQVYAYEPNPNLARFMRRTTASNVQVFQRALSDYNGEGTLSTPVLGSHVSHNLASLNRTLEEDSREMQVPVSTLDSAGHADVVFIKIDVEGHEQRVLAGAVHTIREFRPTLLVEIEQRHSATPVIETINFIREFGYEGFFIDGNRKLDVSLFSYSDHQARYLDSESGQVISSRYVNNFVFTPRGE